MGLEDDKDAPANTIEGINDLLIWVDSPRKRRAMEEFRIEFEKEHGPTDLTKRYTSLFPTKQQNWLAEHHPKRYWDGLPPYVQGYIKKEMETAHKLGKLDDMQPQLIKLYLSREMNIGGESQGR